MIILVRYSTGVSNLLHVRKKNAKINLYVYFRELNRASLKDNYSLSKMDEMLQKVTGSERISMLDGFSGYNPVIMDLKDMLKTTFTTPWGTFSYIRIPFGLINVGAIS
jgi:hypothetical protein